MVRLVISCFVFLAAAVWGAHPGTSGIELQDRFTEAASIGYLIWSLFWGVPAVLGWWWPHRYRGHFWFQLILVPLVLVASVYYSVFGGGVYQFGKAWWLHCKAKAGH